MICAAFPTKNCDNNHVNGHARRTRKMETQSAIWSARTRLRFGPARHVAALPFRFPTTSGKAQFIARPCLPPAELPDAVFPFILSNGRVAHQWHTLTKTGKVPALNKLNPGPFVEIHPDDAAAFGVTEGTLVKVSSRQGFVILPAVVTSRVRPGNCFAPIHWNDQFGDNLAVNAATGEAVDAISLQPEFKFTAVEVAKMEMDLPDDFTREQKMIL
jgi:sulfite reductase (NADPH) flavoprotein alpha-component